MSAGSFKRSAGLASTVVALTALGVGLGGCQLVDNGDNVVNGKQLFVQKCGACHVLNRAGTSGITGPDLDQAFANARAAGFGQSTFEGVVYGQILHPNRDTQTNPETGQELPLMPAGLVTGDDARDVAAYVASAVARSGDDTGQLADVGAAKAQGTAKAKNGELEIPTDPDGSLAYTFASATAAPGSLDITTPNEASVPHNIALEGNGVNEIGKVVQNGGVSEIKVDVKPGKYTFFCSVPGHRAGGMEGTLTVK